MTRWLSIIGIGEDGYEALTPAAQTLVENADIVIGGKRHLAMLPSDDGNQISWPPPIHTAVKEIASYKNKKVCVLATGDPFCFGIGRLIADAIPISEISVIPAPSAFSLACGRLGWAFQEVDTFTLHGRPGALFEPAIQPNAKLLILAQNSDTPREVTERLIARGFEKSKVTVLERLGGKKELIRTETAATWKHNDADPLHVVAVDCIAGRNAQCLSRLTVLPDDAYESDGQLTKQEVRSVTLSALSPSPGQLLWDVGAGCGSIGIEWMRRDRRCRAIAIEPNKKRCQMIANNATTLGTPTLDIVAGDAPDGLSDLETPDAVFIGGGLSQEGVFERCWQALGPGGTLVANAVTLKSEQLMLSLYETHGGSVTRIAITRAKQVGTKIGWKPFMPVTQWCIRKPQNKTSP